MQIPLPREVDGRQSNGYCNINSLPRRPPCLVFPLAGHDFPVCPGDVDAGEEASLVVGFHDVTAESVFEPN